MMMALTFGMAGWIATGQSQPQTFIGELCGSIAAKEANPQLKKTKVESCFTQNRECDSLDNDAAKTLCACEHNRNSKGHSRESCYEAAIQVVDKNKSMMSSEILDQKIPHCGHLKKVEDDSPLYGDCLKNAFFDINVTMEQNPNRAIRIDRRKQQQFDQNADWQQRRSDTEWGFN
jgi:hypothetical protein